MTTVNTKGLMLGMLAIGGLIAGGAMFTGQAAYAQVNISPVNAASAENSDDDLVIQSNEAKVKQKGKVECKASVEDNDVFQVGSNINAAGNDCDVSQSSSINQGNTNTDNDIQVAEATACQALALGIGLNLCDNEVIVEALAVP